MGIFKGAIENSTIYLGSTEITKVYAGAALVYENIFTFNITTNTTNANLRTLALAAGWSGSSLLICTINAGVVISGNTAGNSTAAMTINGSFPAGVTLINNGQIRGRGGAGGNGGVGASLGQAGGAGGRALSVTVPASVNNVGNIWSGGGGGGGGGTSIKSSAHGGGGGGRSGNINSVRGLKGNSNGANGGVGTLAAYGAGGNSQYPGGRGGDVGAAGVANTAASGNGGAAGQAVHGNSNITWIATGSRLGIIV